MYQDDPIFAGSNVGIDDAIHGVRDIWDAKSSKENCVFYSWTENKLSMRSIALECFGKFAIHGRLELFFSYFYIHWSLLVL